MEKIFLILYQYDLGFDEGFGVQSAYKSKEKRDKEFKKLKEEETYFDFIETEIEVEN